MLLNLWDVRDWGETVSADGERYELDKSGGVCRMMSLLGGTHSSGEA